MAKLSFGEKSAEIPRYDLGLYTLKLVHDAKDGMREAFCGEAADMLFHYLVLLRAKGVALEEVEGVLRERHQ